MKRYVFSLHRVLRVRAAQETVARQALRAAAEHAAAAEDDYDTKFRHYQATVAGTATFRGTALNLMAVQEAASRRARETVAAEDASDAARAELAAAREAWSATRQRVQSLEHLDEREQVRHRAATQHAEQAVADDLAGRAAHRLEGDDR
jgi:flagellar export protein FliJ